MLGRGTVAWLSGTYKSNSQFPIHGPILITARTRTQSYTFLAYAITVAKLILCFKFCMSHFYMLYYVNFTIVVMPPTSTIQGLY